jgi:ubiquinone/menaquinone biosynthesis C-methylase UbiE
MADALVACSPVDLDQARVLDLGAGTGAASRAVQRAGARAVAVDLAADMLDHRRGERPPPAQADAIALPFRDACFDAVIAAFCINHVPGPHRALAEARRVTRPSGAVLASMFDPSAPDPVKGPIDAAVLRRGWVPPPWYRQMKSVVEPELIDATSVTAAACRGGLVDVEVIPLAVELPGIDAEAIVRYRIGAAHIAPFIAALPAVVRDALVEEAVGAIVPALPWRPAMFALVARAPAAYECGPRSK